ncbi:MAG: immunoglobulin domain-containing protein [Verrucomicrobia bacterium]|nr:immunoglobulin domain-containing protein [Verrucomicrobiota bacterium]
MKFIHRLYRHLPWFNLPVATLAALLQRTPVLRVASAAETAIVGSPVGQMLRSVFTAAASLGAVHALAGATQLSASTASPLSARVGTALSPSVALTVTGAQSAPGSFRVSGTIPPGLSISGLTGSGGNINGATLVMSGTPTTAGTYTIVFRAWEFANQAGDASSNFNYVVNVAAAANTAPAFSLQPVSQTVSAGGSVTFNSNATGTPLPTYQWFKDGTAVSGATAISLTLSNVQPAQAGSYTVVATNAAGTATSNAATLTVAAAVVAPVVVTQPPTALRLVVGQSLALNVSATGTGLAYQWKRVTSGGVVNVAGATGATLYVVSGATLANPKPLVVRAAGPSLGALGVPGVLSDPKMELFAGSTKNTENDNWGGSAIVSNAMAAVGAFSYVSAGSLDAALLANATGSDNSVAISAGATAPAGTGAVIAEVYDATPSASFNATTTPRLINLSVRKDVGAVLTMGFVIGGATGKTMLVRAIGPTLAAFGVGGTMADPKVELFDSTGKSLALNDNWGGTAALSGAFTDTGAFALGTTSADAALLITLAPGNYTAQVTVATGTTGVALVEVYEVP